MLVPCDLKTKREKEALNISQLFNLKMLFKDLWTLCDSDEPKSRLLLYETDIERGQWVCCTNLANKKKRMFFFCLVLVEYVHHVLWLQVKEPISDMYKNDSAVFAIGFTLIYHEDLKQHQQAAKNCRTHPNQSKSPCSEIPFLHNHSSPLHTLRSKNIRKRWNARSLSLSQRPWYTISA